jgi:hypothetical protein
MPEKLLIFNGATGAYGLPPMTGEKLARFVRGENPPSNLSDFRARYQQREKRMGRRKASIQRSRSKPAGAPSSHGMPIRLLAHPNGGALAVIGHVERAWIYSFGCPAPAARRSYSRAR